MSVINELFMLGGFLLAVFGLWLLSPALACLAAGVLLFVAGGLAARRREPRR